MIVERHSGYLSVSSDIDGRRSEITLPIAQLVEPDQQPAQTVVAATYERFIAKSLRAQTTPMFIVLAIVVAALWALTSSLPMN
jgi:hypothetical protein